MEPTNKSNPIDSMLSSIFGVDRVKTITEAFCVSCDSEGNNAASFRDDISRKEYAISGMCQSCQDDVFGVSDDEPDEDWDDDQAFGSAGMGTDEYYHTEDFGYFGEMGMMED